MIASSGRSFRIAVFHSFLLGACTPAWQEVRSEAGRFTVKMPARVENRVDTYDNSVERVTEYAWKSAVRDSLTLPRDKNIYYVAYCDLAQRPPKDILHNESVQIASDYGGDLIDEIPIDMEGMAGRSFRVVTHHGTLTFRLYLVRSRLYKLYVGNIDPDEMSSRNGRRFFESFQLLGVSPSPSVVFPGRSPVSPSGDAGPGG